MYDRYRDEFDSPEAEEREEDGLAYQEAVREKEEALIHTALERIARARAKGKRNVNLSEEEMAALERRRDQQPEPPKPALASPPPTPAKSAAKGKVNSRSNSSTNLAGKARKRSSGLFGSSPSPAKSNSKAKVNRKASTEQALTYPPLPHTPPGMMVQGPNGAPMYAPIAYYGPSSPEYARSGPGSKPSSRSGSTQRRRETTPPDRADTYPQYPPRYALPPSAMRPESSGSNRSLPDDADWYPPAPRLRSTSNVQHYHHHPDYDPAPAPAMPAAQSRRNISGPPEVRYSSVRRAPPPLGPGQVGARPAPKHSSHSDPANWSGGGRKGSGLSQEIGGGESTSSSTSSGDEQGVQVEILPRGGPGGTTYAISRAPMPVQSAAPLPPAPAPVSGNEGRKRRTGGGHR